MDINRDGDVDVGLRPGQTDVNGARLLLPNLEYDTQRNGAKWRSDGTTGPGRRRLGGQAGHGARVTDASIRAGFGSGTEPGGAVGPVGQVCVAMRGCYEDPALPKMTEIG